MGGYRTLPYYGGKRGYGKAEWIASFLPHTPDSCYVEPFAGMVAVLLARSPVKREVLNDLNRRVVNWLRVVRDYPEDFGRLVEKTPISRVEYEWALTAMDDESLPPLRRALAFHVAVDQSLLRSDTASVASWRCITRFDGGVRRNHRQDEIERIGKRLGNVQLECIDACILLDRIKDMDYCTIYCDPPYSTSDRGKRRGYSVWEVDREGLADLLVAQRGAVGISGYGGEWDMLGWRKISRPALRNQISGVKSSRIEVLWLNDKAAATRPGLFG